MSRALRRLTLMLVALGCRGDANPVRDTQADTLPPIGAGTEILLTRERLVIISLWIHAARDRIGRMPQSLDEVAPPEEEASRYIPLERYLRDGWGRPIEYKRSPDGTYDLRSVGEDGVSGTGDDITLVVDAHLLPGRVEVPSLPQKQ